MSTFEKINTEIQKNPENEILNKEQKEIPEQKYINICENMWKDQEFLKQICKNFNINLRDWLAENWIDFQAILEKNNLSVAI